MSNKYAYITVLSTDSYLPGVLALFESIKRTHTKIENFVVIINESISNESKDKLLQSGYDVVLKPKISIPDIIKSTNIEFPHWSNTFDKFSIFDLTDYDKLVYLDSDIYVARNIDELFDKPHMSAVCAGKSYPGNESWEGLNSGVMVIKPQIGIKEDLIQKMHEMMLKYTGGPRGIGDQDVMEEYFNWKDKKNLHLDEKYNVFAKHTDYYTNNLNKTDLACIHFTGTRKPWSLTTEELSDLKKELYNQKKIQYAFLENYMEIINSII